MSLQTFKDELEKEAIEKSQCDHEFCTIIGAMQEETEATDILGRLIRHGVASREAITALVDLQERQSKNVLKV